MNDLQSGFGAPAMLILGALLLLVIVWKLIKGAIRMLMMVVLIAIIIAAVFWLRSRGILIQ